MNKLTTLAAIAGLATAITTLSASAAVLTHVPKTPNSPIGYDEPEKCTDIMGFMRSVSSGEIASIHNQRIVLTPVCEDPTVPGKNNYGSLFIDGNAEKLRLPIARNVEIMNVLRSRSYDHNDVVSVRFGSGNSVIFYVHQRDMN